MPELRDDIRGEDIEEMAYNGCPVSEIAAHFSCDVSTIRKRFPEFLAKGRARRRKMLREYQWESAKKGNVVMQIWLGKQELGQSEYGAHAEEDELPPYSE